jgi:hypothetical protein
MSNSDFPFGYRLPTDIASQIAVTAHERRLPRAQRPARAHRLPWPRRSRAAENL